MPDAAGRGTVHLVIGSTGAGKTTYAVALADRIRAVRFSIDEWMQALFWMDAADPIDAAWALDRVDRCRTMIWSAAVDAARRGVPVILEIGLTNRASRADAYRRTAEAGLALRLHVLDVPVAERWRRVELRNRDLAVGGQLAFPISRAMFDYVESRWETPDAAELAGRDVVRP